MKKSQKIPTVAELKKEIARLKIKLGVAMLEIKSRPRPPLPEKMDPEFKTWVGKKTDTRVIYGA